MKRSLSTGPVLDRVMLALAGAMLAPILLVALLPVLVVILLFWPLLVIGVVFGLGAASERPSPTARPSSSPLRAVRSAHATG